MLLCASLACGSPEPRVLAPAPAPLLQPHAALPADLDVAVRLDVGWLTSELGAPLARRLILDVLVPASDTAATPLLDAALSRAQLLWLGFRVGESIDAAEKVLILRGQFAGVSPHGHAGATVWAPSQAERGPEHFSRDSSGAGALTRIYPLTDELLIFTSEAEARSVEQVLGTLEQGSTLRPPDRGDLSFAARPAALRGRLAVSYPRLAQRFVGARLLEAYVDSKAGALVLQLELGFETTAQARDAGAILVQLKRELAGKSCVIGVAARAAELSVFERTVRLVAELGPPAVRGLEACVLGGECCA